MEKIILAVIGLVAIGYVVRLFWQETHGKLPCCCSGGCSTAAGKDCCSKE